MTGKRGASSPAMADGLIAHASLVVLVLSGLSRLDSHRLLPRFFIYCARTAEDNPQHASVSWSKIIARFCQAWIRDLEC